MYNQQTKKVNELEDRMKIAKELSDIIFYCASVPFEDFDTSAKLPCVSPDDSARTCACEQKRTEQNFCEYINGLDLTWYSLSLVMIAKDFVIHHHIFCQLL